MRWPWQRETREAIGGYTEIISRLIESQAAGTTQQASATAATEAVAGLLSRSFAAAMVEGPGRHRRGGLAAVPGADRPRPDSRWRVAARPALHGRAHDADPGKHLVLGRQRGPGDVALHGTAYGPSGSSTWRVPQSSVVFIAWGSPTARPYHGLSPSSWAADTARLNANAERSLADEAGRAGRPALAGSARRRRRWRR